MIVRLPFKTVTTRCFVANSRATLIRSATTSAFVLPVSRAISPGCGVMMIGSALGIFAALFIAATLVAVTTALKLARQGSQLFSASLAELRRDDAYRLLILSDPVMLGVDAFDNSAVVIKFFIQTRPLQQWTVKREMLRRIKNEFDRLGIEIPFPHLTVYRGTAEPASRHTDTSRAEREAA